MEIKKITKSYMYPAHGKKICNDEIKKDYVLGCGVTFRLFFIPKDEIPKRKIIYAYGELKKTNDVMFNHMFVTSVISMKFLWFSIGYFYLLKEG